ncbi:uncharacterized protein HD556DRAFT_1451641 [Suillus plorans]|uniref:Uncharacterized protein n=1 Tax=Suillus plorans TaxID=116603 RepID=A0A9P7DA18_9AGAM|nr:uncharacterized protein HD556DRAFT_1451641 [Suillus plorans]KAG1784563.1 hypothetical protein HD556DRAFT_1451641 [Suillus plorans]
MFGSIFALSVDFLPDGLSGAAGESLSAVALVVVSYVQLLAEHVDTQLLKDATQRVLSILIGESTEVAAHGKMMTDMPRLLEVQHATSCRHSYNGHVIG